MLYYMTRVKGLFVDTPQTSSASEQPVKNLVDTLADGTKIKRRMPRQRACNEPADKGKVCVGHLKRWYFFGAEVAAKFGPQAEVYRCEHCRTLYLPEESLPRRTGTLAW